VNRHVALLLLAACGSRDADYAKVVRDFEDFRDKACACKDPQCADKVQEDYQRWAEQMSKQASAKDHVSPDVAKRMADVAVKITDCLAAARGEPHPSGGQGLPAAPAEKLFDAERIIKLAFEQRGQYVISRLELGYVDERGQLDAKYGKAEIDYGRLRPPDPADDPKRPIGAPVEEPKVDPGISATNCPHVTWSGGQRAHEDSLCLAMYALERPRCSVPELWKRARAIDAPARALATLQLVPGSGQPQHWVFEIQDEPRGIHIRHEFADTCQPVVEKP